MSKNHVPAVMKAAEEIGNYVHEMIELRPCRINETMIERFADSIASTGADLIPEITKLMPGWREVIAEIDDLPKNEALGKAMWACLDQIDALLARLRKVVEP